MCECGRGYRGEGTVRHIFLFVFFVLCVVPNYDTQPNRRGDQTKPAARHPSRAVAADNRGRYIHREEGVKEGERESERGGQQFLT